MSTIRENQFFKRSLIQERIKRDICFGKRCSQCEQYGGCEQ